MSNGEELESDDDPDYEAEWDDLSEKAVLVQLLAEQQRTNMLLEEALQNGASDASQASGGATVYRCRKCPAEVQTDERERHAAEAHNAPHGMVEELFEEVEG